MSGPVSMPWAVEPNEATYKERVNGFMSSFPPGFHFNPSDEELVSFYLRNKLFRQRIPPHQIQEIRLYDFNPETLVEQNESYGEGEWFFFTPREKKYPNGSRPKRAAGDGYWKATGADRVIRWYGNEVGYRKALVFYRGKPPRGDKTDWMMHEFRLKDPPKTPNANRPSMQLDEWVLCKVYKKQDRTDRSASLHEAASGLSQEDENETAPQAAVNDAASTQIQEVNSEIVGAQIQEVNNQIPPQYSGYNLGGEFAQPQEFMADKLASELRQIQENSGGFNGVVSSPEHYYDDILREQPPLLIDHHVYDYYYPNIMHMTAEPLPPPPSSMPPFPSVDDKDKPSTDPKKSEFSSQFFDHYP